MPKRAIVSAIAITSVFTCSASAFLLIQVRQQQRSTSATYTEPQDTDISPTSSEISNDPPFKLQRIDHVVLRCKNFPSMFDFYHRILGCTIDQPTHDYLNRFGGALTHLRAGTCYIDLVAYDSNHLSDDGREAVTRMHAGGQGISYGSMEDVQFSSDTSTMDHLCLRVEPFDEQVMVDYLVKENVQIVASGGNRLGADGVGKSIYVRDPEGNVIELKGPPNVHAEQDDGDGIENEKEEGITLHSTNTEPNTSFLSSNPPSEETNEASDEPATQPDSSDVPATPCIRICRYNSSFHNGRVCIGCYREAYEIQAWQSMTAMEKCMTLLDAIDRSDDSEDNFDGAISKEELTMQYEYWKQLAR